MKRILWLAVASAPLLMTNLASAGDYHKNGTLLCSQCHVMHFSQSHGYNPNGTGFYTPLGGATPHVYLLRAEINDLCLGCHDANGFAPDVFGASNTGNGPTDVREAGFLNRVGAIGADGNEATGHTLDSTNTAPGSSPAWSNAEGLNCTDCHHQHGSGGTGHPAGGYQYRNLRSSPGNGTQRWVTYNYENTAYNAARDVYQRQSLEFDESDVDFNEPDTTKSAIANWCAGCHSNFHGDVGSANIGGVAEGGGFADFVRHPAGGVNIGAVGGGHSSLTQYNARLNKVKVMSSLGAWNPAGNDVTPTCISCHKGHGNANAFGLIFRQGTGTLNENGDTAGNQLEDLCGQCHVQASWFANNP